MEDKILLEHGNGGRYTQRLVKNLFQKCFGNHLLNEMHDAARLTSPGERLAFTTDSYVITPLVFPGGDIGKLAVCGTVNDLAVSGARPLYLSAGFIIEEGFSMQKLTEIVASMAGTAKEAGVKIITGDTKVVPRGSADRLFINTSGIGVIPPGVDIAGGYARPGDRIIISGTMGDHGMAVMASRSEINIMADIKSDCAPLNHLIAELLERAPGIRVLRDPTRGGVATTLNEIAVQSGVGIALDEDSLPVRQSVQSACDLLGLEPIYLANEGKFLAVVPKELVNTAMDVLLRHPRGQEAAVIGKVVDGLPGKVYLHTVIGGKRLLDVLVTDQLPRIC
ncbi:MAG: hydrogenase expression/formation protein HypE [Bacillota bacterium]